MTDHAFWTYSLNRYRRAGVADICLELQDSFGADVNLVLFALWLGHDGFRLDQVGARAAADAVAQWHMSVVKPLRSVRKWLKSRDVADTDARDRLRSAVQNCEIDAERNEQQMLFDLIGGPDLHPSYEEISRKSLMMDNVAQVCDAASKATIGRLVSLCL